MLAIGCARAGDGDGSLVLHADPNGGIRLHEFYRHGCGMAPLELASPPISLLRRRRIDQYFFLDGAGARTFRSRFDDRR